MNFTSADPSFIKQSNFKTASMKRLLNIVEKGENANQHFPLFPQSFLSYKRKDRNHH